MLSPLRSSSPLWFGTAIHEALAEWYQPGFKRGRDLVETFTASLDGDRKVLVRKFNEEDEKEYMDAREMGILMLTRYKEVYGLDPDWDVIATEQPFRLFFARKKSTVFGQEIPAMARWLRYLGTIDGVYRDRESGEIWLMEHKTAAAIDVNHLPLDDQAGAYWAVAGLILRKMGILKPGEDIAGIMYNFLRKALPETRTVDEQGKVRNKPQKKHYVEALMNHYGQDSTAEEMESWAKDLPKMKVDELEELAEVQKLVVYGEVSAQQPPPFFERFPVYRSKGERKTQLERIRTEAFFAESFRSGALPLYKTPGRDCRYMCEFHRMCLLHEQGDMESVEEFKQTQFKTRDPYADHHEKKSAEG